MEQLPNRSSDSGPEPTPAPSIDQLVEDARDALYDFTRLRADDLGVERKIRRQQLAYAAQQSAAALEAWDALYGPYAPPPLSCGPPCAVYPHSRHAV